MRRILIVMLMVGMLNFGPSAYPQDTRSRSEGRRVHRVSLIRIIANPGELDGEHVRVIGCLGGAGLDGAPGIFVSESDVNNGILSNAVGITVHDSRTIRGLHGRYVIVSGLYHAPPRGVDFNGYIDNILEVIPLKAGNTSY